MANHPFSTDVHSASLGEEIELFQVDPRPIDPAASVMHFCSSIKTTGAVKWKNAAGTGWVDYTPVPIEAEGFQATAQGTLPRPRLRISNIPSLGSLVGPLFSTLQQYQDLIGAKVTRYRTLGKYLYGGAAADYHAHWPPDTYVICQKTAQNPLYVEWELAPHFDAHGIKLPKRLLLRDVCQLRYRVWDAANAQWIYDDTENACPIQNRLLTVGGNEFDFSEVGNWHLGTDWSISGGKLNHAAGNSIGVWTMAYIWSYAKPYIGVYCEFDATVSAGLCYFGIYREDIPGYGGWGDGWVTVNETGHYSTIAVSTWNCNHKIVFSADGSFAGSIDNLKVDAYIDEAGRPWNDPSKDVCAHNFSACQARWYLQAMPFMGFPSIARVRI